MVEQTDIEELIASNPKVDKDQLLDVIAVVKHLREQGLFEETGYRLASPFSGGPIKKSEEDAEDPRTFQLRVGR
jgi:hypothetical protein